MKFILGRLGSLVYQKAHPLAQKNVVALLIDGVIIWIRHNTDTIRPPVTDRQTVFRKHVFSPLSLVRLLVVGTWREGMKPLLPAKPSTGANVI